MLTAEEKKMLSRKALEFGERFIVGRGPKVSNDDWCHCGIGHLMRAAGFKSSEGYTEAAFILRDRFGRIATYLDDLVAPNLFTEATMLANGGHPDALAVPYIALADALDPPEAT